MNAYYILFFIAASTAALAALAPAIAIAVAAVIVYVVAILVDRAVATSVNCLNRISRRCRQSLLPDTTRACAPTGFELRTAELTEAVARLQGHERELSIAYDTRRCSEADTVLAASKRLQAEIALVRHKHMPRPFSETVSTQDCPVGATDVVFADSGRCPGLSASAPLGLNTWERRDSVSAERRSWFG